MMGTGARSGAMVEIKSSSDLRRWLEARPENTRQRDAVAIAARAALRMLPLADVPALPASRRAGLTLAVFRATALSRVVAVHPTRSSELRSAIRSASRADVHAAANAPASYYAARAAASAVACTDAPAAFAFAAAADATYSAADAARYTGDTVAEADDAANTANTAAAADVAALSNGVTATSLARAKPIWLRKNDGERHGVIRAETPKKIADHWRAMRAALLAQGDDWDFWVDWYEAVLKGRTPFPKLKGKARENLEVAIALIPDEVWARGPAVANAEIKRLVAEAHVTSDLPFPTEGQINLEMMVHRQPPKVPKPQPAAIEPVVLADGRIGLPSEAPAVDLDGESITAALRACQQAFRDLADDCEDAGNVDRRAVKLLRRVSERIPDTVPTQDELFRVAHIEELLETYSATVNEEWPTLLAKSYHALTLQFERTMRQFPKWRQFKRNAAQDKFESQQLQKALGFATSIVMELEGREAQKFVVPELSVALAAITAPLPEAKGAPESLPATLSEARQLDALESTNNTLKKIFEVALSHVKGYIAPIGHGLDGYARNAGKGFEKAAKKQGGPDGEKLFKWARRLIIGAGTATVAWVGGLIEALPSMFSWLGSVASFLLRLVF